jgi:hypothetical protein
MLKVFDQYEKKINQILEKIAKRYPTRIELTGFGDRDSGRKAATLDPTEPSPVAAPEFHEVPQGRGSRPEAWSVCSAMDQFLWLAHHGVFSNFRRCERADCKECFLARRPEARYCSTECQRKEYEQDPERKKRRAEYQRNHYHAYLSVAAVKRRKQLLTRTRHEKC